MSFETSDGNLVFATVNKHDFHKLKIVAEEERRLSIPKKLDNFEKSQGFSPLMELLD